MRAASALCLVSLSLLLPACKSGPTDEDALRWRESQAALAQAEQVAASTSPSWKHQGPSVAPGGTGPARFALLVHEGFDEARAMELCRFIDGWWREPGNEGYEAVMDRLAQDLGDMGFGRLPEYELRELVTELREPAWTPLNAALSLRVDDQEQVLHRFTAPADRDRLLLPKGAPNCDVQGALALSLEEVRPGSVLVTEASLSRRLLEEAAKQGALAVLSAALESYNNDPTGAQRHLDAIGYRTYPRGATLPAAQISPRSLARLREAKSKNAAASVRLRGNVRTESKQLRTLVATIVGTEQPEQAVALAAHVQEPGACDNASGVATQLELLRALVGLIDAGRVRRPARSLSLVFGLEMTQSQILIDQAGRKFIAAIAADMTGESRERTGAIPLLERAPDPALTKLLPPDEPSGWGSSAGRYESAPKGGLALVVRTALFDTALAAGAWETREHGFEGGSDHQVFLRAGIPAVLLWHFPDFAYHTSLDRMEHVDPGEMHRMGTALASAAMALADPAPGDLDRYLRSLALEQELRVGAATQAGDAALAERWRAWLRDSRQWLRELCLGPKAGALPAALPTDAAPPAAGSSDKPH